MKPRTKPSTSGMFGLPWGRGGSPPQRPAGRSAPSGPRGNPGIVIARRGGPRFPGPPGACSFPLSAISEAYEYMVVGAANPYLTRWVPPHTIVGGSPAGEIFPLGHTRPLPDSSSDTIHPGDASIHGPGPVPWHHVSIAVTHDVIYPTAAPVDAPEQKPGNDATLLKARITLAMGNNLIRRFDFDIGAGVEFDVRCRAVMSIEALVPDPTAVPDFVPPELVDASFQFATSLVTCVSCGATPQGYRTPLRYSQVFFMQGEDPVVMPIVSEAAEVLLLTNASNVAAGSVVGQFAYIYDSPIPIMFSPPTTFSPMGSLTSAPGETQVKGDIPYNANAILIGHAAAPARLNVIQFLDV